MFTHSIVSYKIHSTTAHPNAATIVWVMSPMYESCLLCMSHIMSLMHNNCSPKRRNNRLQYHTKFTQHVTCAVILNSLNISVDTFNCIILNSLNNCCHTRQTCWRIQLYHTKCRRHDSYIWECRRHDSYIWGSGDMTQTHITCWRIQLYHTKCRRHDSYIWECRRHDSYIWGSGDMTQTHITCVYTFNCIIQNSLNNCSPKRRNNRMSHVSYVWVMSPMYESYHVSYAQQLLTQTPQQSPPISY